MDRLTEQDMGELAVDVDILASKWARRLGGEDLHGRLFASHTEHGSPEANRRVRLLVLTALRHIADQAEQATRSCARSAAAAGADYGDLAAAAGLASRQLARHTWPGLASVTKAARDAQRTLRAATQSATGGQAMTDQAA